MTDTTWSQAAAQMLAVVGRLAALEGELNAWCAGTANGGPAGDGRYPFTQPDGVVALILCPAKLATMTQLTQADRDVLTLSDATARGALFEAERKSESHYGEAEPPAPRYSDLWINGVDIPVQFWDGEQWRASGGGGGGGGSSSALKANPVATLPVERVPRIGDAAFTWQDAVEIPFRLDQPGIALISASLVQSYTSAAILPALWSARILLDGAQIDAATGDKIGIETPQMLTQKAITEGDHVLAIQWRAAKSGLRLTQCAIRALVF